MSDRLELTEEAQRQYDALIAEISADEKKRKRAEAEQEGDSAVPELEPEPPGPPQLYDVEIELQTRHGFDLVTHPDVTDWVVGEGFWSFRQNDGSVHILQASDVLAIEIHPKVSA